MTRLGARGSILADEYVESYVCWREACEDVRAAYERWTACGSDCSDLGFALYFAALDREAQAAGVHLSWVTRVGAAVR